MLQIPGECVERVTSSLPVVLGWLNRRRTMAALPITKGCYDSRIAELRQQLNLLHLQCRQGGLSEELEDLIQQQIRCVSSYLWALYAETEED
jgi:hypothetical protein